jgi:hypothetical protein
MYHSFEVDLHYLTRESAKSLVIETIYDCHSRKIPCVKFITGRGNHINATGERGVLYETFPSWMADTEIKHLIEHSKKYDGYYLVYLDLVYSPSPFKRLIFGLILLSLLFLSLLMLIYILSIVINNQFQ